MSTEFGRNPLRVADSAAVMSDTPIFLTGFARSGTTWVNGLMRDYFDIGLVNEGQFIVTFGNRIARYGDLTSARNQKKLINDLAKDKFFVILKKNYGIEIDWNAVAVSAKSFSAIVMDVLCQIARQSGKKRIGSKYPVFGRHIRLLNHLFPDCLVINVIRDGRDCALSHERLTWGYQNTYSAATHWRDYMMTIRSASKALHGRYLEIRYEDLLLDPESAVGTLERFITSSHGDAITKRFIESKVAMKSNKIEQWRHAMPMHSQAIFESVAGDMLKDCGYPLTGVSHSPTLLSKAWYIVHNRMTREGYGLARKMFKNISEKK